MQAIRAAAHPSRSALVVGALAVALMVAACAGSSDGGAGATSAPAVATTDTTTPTEPGSTTIVATTTAPTAPVATTTLPVQPAAEKTAPSSDATLKTADGRERTYHVFVPSDLASLPQPVPLLVALHGGTGWGKQFELNSGFDGLAEANGFIVVYPDGIGIGKAGDQLRTWNAGKCCGPAINAKVDDVGFITQLVTQLQHDYPIDPARTFAAGHSNGGMLALRIACEAPEQFAAIGVQSSALEVDGCDPKTPISVLQIHGGGDQNVPITGGKGANAISGVAYTVPIEASKALAAGDGCAVPPAVAASTENPDLTRTTWTCPGTTAVQFLEVAGARHAWMGHTVGGGGVSGPPYAKLDASLEIWTFLVRHPRRS